MNNILLIPKTINDTIQQDNKDEQQFGGNSFNNSQQLQFGQQQTDVNQKPSKPSFTNPFYNADSMQASQKIEPKQPPIISNKVSQEIQTNMDDTIIDDNKPDYQPKYVSKHSRPYQSSNFNQPSQSSRITNNNPNLYNFQNIPSYNPINYAQYSQQAIQSQQNIPTLQTQPQSQQYINMEPQFQQFDVIQQHPVQVQEFENTNYNPNQSQYAPQLSNDPKKKYDFSQWDKYNDGIDTVPIQPYTVPIQPYTVPIQPYSVPIQPYTPIQNTYTNPYEYSSPIPNYNINEDYNKTPDTINDYKPGDFRPSTYNFTPYDYRYSDQQLQPNTIKENGTQQLYQQKPGQQACQIF